MKNLTSGPQNYTRENILDHMHRFAYFGVVASMAYGSDFGELPYVLRDETAAGRVSDAARFLTAGRGLAPLDEISPNNMRHSAILITTEDDIRARGAGAESHDIKMLKTWVDDRGGTVRKFPPATLPAIIDEAHRNNIKVVVHATGLADVKDLLARQRRRLRPHGQRRRRRADRRSSRRVRTCSSRSRSAGRAASSMRRGSIRSIRSIAETVPPEQIKRLQTRLASTKPEDLAEARVAWDKLARGIKRLSEAGVRIGVGTDGGGQQGDQFIGWTMHTELENMVAAGMTPAQVLVAATRTSAGIAGLDDLGTVAVGKSADFVVLDANPLDDITNTRRINRVYMRGQGSPARRDARQMASRIPRGSGEVARQIKSSPTSIARALWVSAPDEMKSTPDSAIARTRSCVTPPEASSVARPLVIATARFIISGGMLSSRIASAPAASASSS